MPTARRSALFILLLASLVLAACSPAAPATVEVTRMVEGTPQTVIITATPEAAPARSR